MSWGLFVTTVAFGCNYSKIVEKPLKKKEKLKFSYICGSLEN